MNNSPLKAPFSTLFKFKYLSVIHFGLRRTQQGWYSKNLKPNNWNLWNHTEEICSTLTSHKVEIVSKSTNKCSVAQMLLCLLFVFIQCMLLRVCKTSLIFYIMHSPEDSKSTKSYEWWWANSEPLGFLISSLWLLDCQRKIHQHLNLCLERPSSIYT